MTITLDANKMNNCNVIKRYVLQYLVFTDNEKQKTIVSGMILYCTAAYNLAYLVL